MKTIEIWRANDALGEPVCIEITGGVPDVSRDVLEWEYDIQARILNEALRDNLPQGVIHRLGKLFKGE